MTCSCDVSGDPLPKGWSSTLYAPIRGRPGQRVEIEVRHRHGRLPIVILKKAS